GPRGHGTHGCPRCRWSPGRRHHAWVRTRVRTNHRAPVRPRCAGARPRHRRSSRRRWVVPLRRADRRGSVAHPRRALRAARVFPRRRWSRSRRGAGGGGSWWVCPCRTSSEWGNVHGPSGCSIDIHVEPSSSRIGTVVQAPSSNGLKTWPRQHALWFWTVTAIPPTHSGGFRTSRYIGHLRCRLREGGGRTGARATPPARTARRVTPPEESK